MLGRAERNPTSSSHHAPLQTSPANTLEPLAFSRDGQVNYVHADHQGSTVARTDIYGTVTKGYLHNSFGVPANQGFDPYHYTYTGREWDNIFKVFYYRARFYDPEAGRFLSTDPIGFAGGDVNLFAYVDTVGKPLIEINLYAYTGNNPINRTDPLGLDWLDDLANFSAGIGDTISLGGTKWIRQQLGTDDVVDQCSGYYAAGKLAGYAWWTGVGLRGSAELSRVQSLRWLNNNRYVRIGPGRFGGKTNVPSIRIGPSPWNKGKWWTHWRLGGR